MAGRRDIEPHLGAMLDEFEEELFRLADQARNPGIESGYMQTLRSFRLNRADLVPRFILELEAQVAAIRTPPSAHATPLPGGPGYGPATAGFGTLSLVDESVMDEDTVLREIAARQEARANLALHLLGQRFGVLAGAPAFDTERLPLGPQALCRAMRAAAHALDIEHDSRLLLYRIFDRHVMQGFWRVLDRLDELLDREGILSGLTYVPVRIRPSPQPRERTGEARPAAATPPARDAAPADRAPATPAPGRGGYRAGDPQRPHTGWMGEPIEELDEDEQLASQQLQQLLNSRRELLGKLRPGRKSAGGAPIATEEVFSALGHLQGQSMTAGGTPDPGRREAGPAGAGAPAPMHAELSPRDNDTFSCSGCCSAASRRSRRRAGRLAGQAPAGAAAAGRPRQRVLRSQPPPRAAAAGTVAEAHRWLDDADFDPQFCSRCGRRSTVIEKYHGDRRCYTSNEQLQTRLQARCAGRTAREAHAEAARGRRS